MSCSEPSRVELTRSFHEPQKQAWLRLVLSVEPVRAELLRVRASSSSSSFFHPASTSFSGSSFIKNNFLLIFRKNFKKHPI
jgi:hypothetical protein